MRLILGTGPGAGHPHFTLIYRMPTGEFFSYDEDGSRCLGLVEAHVVDIAKAYDPRGTKAKWITAF